MTSEKCVCRHINFLTYFFFTFPVNLKWKFYDEKKRFIVDERKSNLSGKKRMLVRYYSFFLTKRYTIICFHLTVNIAQTLRPIYLIYLNDEHKFGEVCTSTRIARTIGNRVCAVDYRIDAWTTKWQWSPNWNLRSASNGGLIDRETLALQLNLTELIVFARGCRKEINCVSRAIVPFSRVSLNCFPRVALRPRIAVVSLIAVGNGMSPPSPLLCEGRHLIICQGVSR